MASKKRTSPDGSLLSPESTGGIVGGSGFDFQTRYAACHLPLWMLDASFHQLFFEGTGDIDVRYVDGGASRRIHIQVKDHNVTPAEFKSVLEAFQKIDAGLPGVYEQFVLACPSVSAALRPIENGLARLRGAKPFYDDIPSVLSDTSRELTDRIQRAGLGIFNDLLVKKIHFDIGHGDLHKDDRAIEIFVARLLDLPAYATSMRKMVQPAFAELLRALDANRGQVLDRRLAEEILHRAVRVSNEPSQAVVLSIHNWTKEKYRIPADHELDWSSHFDRATRRVPTPDVWKDQLVPELRGLQKRILVERPERLIRFQGKCALSTGILLGSTFPKVGGWSFELEQPPANAVWRSDATAAPAYRLTEEILQGSAEGTDIVVGLNATGDGRAEMSKFIGSSGRPPKAYLFLSAADLSSRSIASQEEAVAFAIEARERLAALLKRYGLSNTRMFFYGPFALAVFLGQRLTSVGSVKLFEYQNPGYVPSCSLET